MSELSLLVASHGEVCTCEYCQEIQKLAPKLAQPGWVRWMGIPTEKPTVTVEELRATKKERLKAAKAKHKATTRLATILSGGRVRTTLLAA
jgi:hypothetical protein